MSDKSRFREYHIRWMQECKRSRELEYALESERERNVRIIQENEKLRHIIMEHLGKGYLHEQNQQL